MFRACTDHQSDTDLTFIESAQTLARLSGHRTVLAARDTHANKGPPLWRRSQTHCVTLTGR